MTTFRCLLDILITSWLFTAQWARDCKQSRRDQDVRRTLKLMMGSWRPMWITEGRCWLWGKSPRSTEAGCDWQVLRAPQYVKPALAANICRTTMFGMEFVADDVETWDCEDVCLLKANDVNVMDLCQWLYDVTLSCMMRRAGPTAWKPRSALSEGFFLALWPGSIRIRPAGGIFGFPRLVYSPRYLRGGRRGRRLPAPQYKWSSQSFKSVGTKQHRKPCHQSCQLSFGSIACELTAVYCEQCSRFSASRIQHHINPTTIDFFDKSLLPGLFWVPAHTGRPAVGM